MIVVSRQRRVDWARVVDNLVAAGMSQHEIAAAVDIGFNTLRDYRADPTREPAFWVGLKLLRLWSERTNIAWTDAPMKNVTPSVSQILRAHR